jgi:hypothetical protein
MGRCFVLVVGIVEKIYKYEQGKGYEKHPAYLKKACRVCAKNYNGYGLEDELSPFVFSS